MKCTSEQLIENVKATIEKHSMLREVQKVVIAFSSGPDSVCLLDVLHRLYGRAIEFHLVYVNHGIRPAKNLKPEQELTRYYARRYGARCKIIFITVEKKRLGLEAAAREKRYQALIDYMKHVGADRIALGHNLDDVLETFFLNLARGSGMRGLLSIPAKRLPFIRPLINLKKEEIVHYLRSKKLRYSVDETNRLLERRRNIVRHKVIPALLRINPELHKIIQRDIAILKQDEDYLNMQAEKTLTSVVRRKRGHIALDIKKILRYNPAVANRVVMNVLKELRHTLEGFESKHVEAIISLKDKASGKRLVLPKGLFAQREYDTIIIGTTKPVTSLRMSVDTEKDTLTFDNHVVRLRTVKRFSLRRLKPNCEVFDLDQLEPPLFIRTRRQGDYIETKIGKKKMKKIYHEYRIPVHERNELAVLCDQKGILWMLGIVRAHRGFIGKKTKKILAVEYEPAH